MSKKISASYEKGVLRIVLPKSEQGQKKGLKIKVQ
jgi:HSP20 family molecular chaperone IbpA